MNKKQVAKRIRQIRGKTTLARFGKKIGVAHTTVKRYEDGSMAPSAGALMRIGKVAGKSLNWILTGRETESIQPPAPPEPLPEDEYVTVPLVEGKIAAGEPIIAEENVIDWVVLHVRPIKKAAAGRYLVASRISGDSMWPYLADGDIVVIDKGIDKNRINEGRIYAVYADGGITAKLVQQKGRYLFLKPLNPASSIISIDLRLNPTPIVGLVIGAWKDFNKPLISV